MRGAHRSWVEAPTVILRDPFRIITKGDGPALNHEIIDPHLQAVPRCLLVPKAKAIELRAVLTSLFGQSDRVVVAIHLEIEDPVLARLRVIAELPGVR